MIGNDIVDLQLASIQSNWKRPGFLDKQFTTEEKKQILDSENPFNKTWLLWSMKEAAYKCYVQKHKRRFFAPKLFKCVLDNDCQGKVFYKEIIYETKSSITDDYIHTIAKIYSNTNINLECFKVSENSNVSEQINNRINKLFSHKIQIKKDTLNIPYLFLEDKKLPYTLSKSHHGKYAGFAISKM